VGTVARGPLRVNVRRNTAVHVRVAPGLTTDARTPTSCGRSSRGPGGTPRRA